MCVVRLSDVTSDRKTLVSQIVKSHTEPFTIWCQQDFVKTSKTNVKIGHTFYKVKNMDYIYRILNNKFGKDIREKITSYFIETLNPNNHLSLNKLFCHYSSSMIIYNEDTNSYQSSMSINTNSPYQNYKLSYWKYLMLFHQVCIDITQNVVNNIY
jgi:hypothetical protein